ncbi:RHS domain-containing protein, partial [Pseudomonas brassicacearum]|uniref:RHS repeat-associated core domain-containing protein n=1 Tax=Pseudomonas brassicacearum TaxID=930166 RepID=UPI003464EA3B
NRLLKEGDRHYDYDAFGNLLRERRGQALVSAYRYDSQHRLIGVTTADGRETSYRYDAFGRRISKTVDGLTTEFFWQGDQVVAENSPRHHRSYVYEPGTFRPLAMLDGEGPEKATPFYYHLDHLGTPQELTSYSGQIVWSARYNGYGKLTELQHGGGEQLEQPLRFQGQYFDPESGLHYNRHRYYNPETGRYLTPDPSKLEGGLNGYRYTLNPTGWVDPLGLACQCPGDVEADGPFSEIVPGGGLAAHEARGGHLMKKHIGRSEAQLRKRLDSEPHVPTASTFPDRATAELSVSSVLKAKETEIDGFLRRPEKKLMLQQSFPAPVGVGVIRKSGKLENLSVVVLVLKKSKESPTGYNLLTGYVEKNEK